MKKKNGVINKAFQIIKAFVDIQENWGVRELSRYLNIPPSTLHRLLHQLQKEGIIEFNSQNEKYKIGVELIKISAMISSKIDIKVIARPFMQKLVEKYNETICLVLYHSVEKKVVFVEKIEGHHPLQYVIKLGELQSVPYGATGKSILAYLEPEEIEQIFQQEKLPLEEVQKIKKELVIIKEKGFAFTQDQRHKGATGIAAPIFNSAGQPIASLVYTVPISRFSGNEEKIGSEIKQVAMEISELLGHS